MAPASRYRLNVNGRICAGGRPARRSILPGRIATGVFIVAICWQPLAGGVMIGAEVGRTTNRFGESRVPRYGGLMVLPKNG